MEKGAERDRGEERATVIVTEPAGVNAWSLQLAERDVGTWAPLIKATPRCERRTGACARTALSHVWEHKPH